MHVTDEQKREFFHRGYLILKGVVPDELVDKAQRRIKSAEKGENLMGAREITDLVNRSLVTPILNEMMGEFDPPSLAQVGIIKKSEPQGHFHGTGYRDHDVPYYGYGLHAEGLFSLGAPQQELQGSVEEVYRQMIARGPKGDIGRSADVIGSNMVPLFQDREMTLSVGSCTAFAIVPLNDQTIEGCGQTAVVPGGHHVLEQYYRWQDHQGGVVGPEGPGWPRFNIGAPNRAGFNLLPDGVHQKMIEIDPEPPARTPDGRPWARPTQILMEPGDACITIYQMPHTGTRNENGTESRKNMIYRIRNKKRQPNVVVTGITDHPDRGQQGEWLEFEQGNDPFARSRHALTHMWEEWEGMADIVAAEQAPRYDFDGVALEY
ncbi:MAG: hypothetical protein O2780_05285 [Proteobacteria bacterium]|jgi:hypothetical protein|nr:hypothetical protein [Pseudomonadota bacterium]MDA1299466.1 hypothetical protein [Pseudomonadota bacterium]